jgi:hypothetical protein
MRVRDALIAWTPPDVEWPVKGPNLNWATRGQVKVGLLPAGPNTPNWSDLYEYTGGAAYIRTRKLNGTWARAQAFADFNEVVVGTGIDPVVAHEAFWAIDEYREAVANRDFYRMQPQPIRKNAQRMEGN